MKKGLTMKNTEPNLRDIEDYNTLKGEKKRIVWLVILSGLLIGAIFLAAKVYYGSVDDSISVNESISKIPLK